MNCLPGRLGPDGIPAPRCAAATAARVGMP
jgi:hypothetical protein